MSDFPVMVMPPQCKNHKVQAGIPNVGCETEGGTDGQKRADSESVKQGGCQDVALQEMMA